MAFLEYTDEDYVEETDIFTTYDCFEECLPESNKIFPFATNGGGDIFFF
ncbi:hypothetical protein NNC19_18615 [Clostridium sp. SHJSY1]|nr:hypothetical protein [Clostridium sp. SHJSY1]MDS0527706.1 hypothetical protein [Clostridium sp. SHJSY1]